MNGRSTRSFGAPERGAARGAAESTPAHVTGECTREHRPGRRRGAVYRPTAATVIGLGAMRPQSE